MSLIDELEKSTELIPADCCGMEIDLNSELDNYRILCGNCLRAFLIDAMTLRWLAKNGGMSKDKLRITCLSATNDINGKLEEFELPRLDL